jgi:hypothetical protein
MLEILRLLQYVLYRLKFNSAQYQRLRLSGTGLGTPIDLQTADILELMYQYLVFTLLKSDLLVNLPQHHLICIRPHPATVNVV